MAEKEGKTNFVHMTVPHNKKEAGMVALHHRGYNLKGFYNDLSRISPMDGLDWTQEEKKGKWIFALIMHMHSPSVICFPS